MKTEILLDHEPTHHGYIVRALLRITGSAPPRTDRRPLDLALVLDRSGSMQGDKLANAKKAAITLVRRLADDDVVSVVAYDDEVATVVARATGARKQGVVQAIQAIGTGGTTNLSGGWLRGRELVAPEERAGVAVDEPGTRGPAAVTRVLLLTDGLANVGITDPGALRDLVAGAAARGVATTTIGFGEGYDERLLRAMAEAGGGSTYYIETPDQAPAVFEAEIQGLMSLAAQNVAVTVSPAPAVTVAAVHHQYPRHQQDDGALRLELGDLYALEPRSLLCEFLISSDVDAAEVDVATLAIEGHVLLHDGGVEKRTLDLPIRVTRDEAGVVNPDVRREILVQEAARVREEALRDRVHGRYDDAARKLRDVAERIRADAHPTSPADASLRDEAADLDDMARRYDQHHVSEADAKYLHQRAYATRASKPSSIERVAHDRARRRQP